MTPAADLEPDRDAVVVSSDVCLDNPCLWSRHLLAAINLSGVHWSTERSL